MKNRGLDFFTRLDCMNNVDVLTKKNEVKNINILDMFEMTLDNSILRINKFYS